MLLLLLLLLLCSFVGTCSRSMFWRKRSSQTRDEKTKRKEEVVSFLPTFTVVSSPVTITVTVVVFPACVVAKRKPWYQVQGIPNSNVQRKTVSKKSIVGNNNPYARFIFAHHKNKYNNFTTNQPKPPRKTSYSIISYIQDDVLYINQKFFVVWSLF